ncbi:MAG: acetylornithine deacetylase [Candidatus Binataceae bacterium]|nr:acetylornithine deacetylase [Candidatus Binataceae bacterium]
MNTYLYEVLDRLVAFDTVSVNSDVPAIEYLAGHFEHAGFTTSLHRIDVGGVAQANLVAWAGPPREGGLIISGHVDTVPFAGQPGWNRDPLKLETAGDRIFGRGTTDMKGFLAQCADAARALDRQRLQRPLVFLFTADEEVGMLGAERIAPLLAEILGEVPRPHLAWIGEPTSYAVMNAHKSVCAFEVKVRGRGGHSGAPQMGVNAIAVMGKVIETIGRLQAERRAARSAKFAEVFPESPHDVMNFGTIAGGIATNVIAERCSMRMTYRSLPGVDPLDLYREVGRRLAQIDPHDYGSPDIAAAIELGPAMIAPAMLAPRGTTLEQALFAVTGATTAAGAPFATDGAWFARAGIATLICGPGDFDQAHQPNESIGRGAFERGPAMILEVIDRLCCRDLSK